MAITNTHCTLSICLYLHRQIGNTQMIKQTLAYSQFYNYGNIVLMGPKSLAGC
uniref:Alternative protein SLC2A2 n=1 Tax=Homo sapiens TaxID=9606 RepID=L8E6W0_HUMAN|nr:alternative protein SLC2A2 [Homo sapiens]